MAIAVAMKLLALKMVVRVADSVAGHLMLAAAVATLVAERPTLAPVASGMVADQLKVAELLVKEIEAVEQGQNRLVSKAVTQELLPWMVGLQTVDVFPATLVVVVVEMDH